MNDPRAFNYEREDEMSMQVAPGAPVPPQGQYKFSPEELKVIAECNSESFFQRSLPLGTILGLGTYAAVQKGHLKPNPRFGAFPKMTLAVVMGYFIGKFSYQQTCAEKLMALPGSYIGQILRDRRDGRLGTLPPPPPPKTTTMFGATPNDIYSDAGPGNSLDLDIDRPLFGPDDTYRSNNEVSTLNPPDSGPLQPQLSYDDLRRKNRGEYNNARQDPYKVDPNAVPTITRAQPQTNQPAQTPANQKTNKYGDVMD